MSEPQENEFRDARKRWLTWLSEDEEHSISGQLSQLLWQDAAFRTFNQARLLTKDQAPTSAVAPLLARFLDQGYVAGQVLGISKLVEFSDPKHPKKGVVSLRRLVDELIANRHLLTRENYLAQDNLPYDYEPVRAAAWAEAFKNAENGVAFWHGEVGGPQDYDSAQRLHELFDRLSGISPDKREKTDLIADATLKRLDDALQDPVFESIKLLRHKTLAHAADSFSRGQVDGLPKGLKFEEVDRALNILLGVTQVISATFLYSAWRGSAVPVAQHDQLEHLDLAFTATPDIERLREFWNAHSAERDGWLSEAHEALLPPVADKG